MKGGYGRGKNHKGGGYDCYNFYTVFRLNNKKQQKKIIRIGQNEQNKNYFFSNPLDSNQEIIVWRKPNTAQNMKSRYYLENNILDNINETAPAKIEDLFVAYVKYQKRHQINQTIQGENVQSIINNTIDYMTYKYNLGDYPEYLNFIEELKKLKV